MPEECRTYTIVQRVEETPDVATFFVRPVAGERPAFVAGQFINIALPGHTEAKSYTIASAPRDELWAITVRAAGAFSTKLMSHQAGDTLEVSEPLGYFCADPAPAPRLWLAGGIGITPFMSMVREGAPLQPTTLYYSNRTAEDIVFKDELENSSIKVRHFITREPAPPGMIAGRISEQDIKDALQALSECQVYICGSIGFVRDYWSLLRRLGVSEDRLFTEAFF
jgi:ferredoxin-NADP reductase